ncbi:hypothetical protein BDA99DRAFT_542899 [Phascolomyces articulosus]|uniref:Uncharacterized protein n=1 Tax=Phascolomyces articulosus TaxID=60185 RepID=A0AAD5K1Y0_9FUNG|nr:hypothetical protein BDA99DRAFT_542899 [Phascolomyces articulosus]
MIRSFSSNASSSASSSSNRNDDSNVNLNPSHAAALAKNQAKEAEISREMLAMKKGFKDWCAENYCYEIEPNVFKAHELVTEAKLLRFLKEVVDKMGNRKRRRNSVYRFKCKFEFILEITCCRPHVIKVPNVVQYSIFFLNHRSFLRLDIDLMVYIVPLLLSERELF